MNFLERKRNELGVTTMENVDKEDVFFYLDALRDSGQINMMGARPHIQHNFDLGKSEATELLMEWMKDETRHV